MQRRKRHQRSEMESKWNFCLSTGTDGRVTVSFFKGGAITFEVVLDADDAATFAQVVRMHFCDEEEA